jgi:hypothetical protein
MGNARPGTCFICETFKLSEARNVEPSLETAADYTYRIECPRCGVYFTSTDWYDDFPGLRKPLREPVGLRLSALIRAHNDEKKKPPFLITHDNFERLAKQEAPKANYSSCVERLLLQFADRTAYPGLQSDPQVFEELAARVELPGRAVKQLLTQMRDQELINAIVGEYDRYSAQIQPKGWARVDELQASRARSDRVFVAMWFDPSMKSAYDLGIEPALLACGYEKPFRVDDREHQANADKPGFQLKIDDRIIVGIRQARFVVVDVTGQRCAVYYEAGFAEGLGTPVIWTCREDVPEHMNFDTRQKEHILWTDPPDLKAKLEDKIRARDWHRK